MTITWTNAYSKLKDNLFPSTTANRENLQWAIKNWQVVQDRFLSASMVTEQMEMDFFRTVKPRFTALIEFYLLLNEVDLFCPDEPLAAMEYWNAERERINRFQTLNADFFDYLQRGDHSRDEDYFLRRTAPSVTLTAESIYFDEHCRSAKDPVVRRSLAFAMFRQFVEHKSGNPGSKRIRA